MSKNVVTLKSGSEVTQDIESGIIRYKRSTFNALIYKSFRHTEQYSWVAASVVLSFTVYYALWHHLVGYKCSM